MAACPQEEVCDVPRFLSNSAVCEITDEELVEQRTPAWFARRKAFNASLGMTSSQWGSLFFVKNEEEFIEQWNCVFRGIRKPMDEKGKLACAWGTKMEDYAIQHFLTKNLSYWITEAQFTISHMPGLGSSPDGLYYNTKTGESGVVEIKCPYANGKKTLYPKPPYYYIPQQHMHMACMNMDKSLFVQFGYFRKKERHRAYIFQFDKTCWQLMMCVKDSFSKRNYVLFLSDISRLKACCERIATAASPFSDR